MLRTRRTSAALAACSAEASCCENCRHCCRSDGVSCSKDVLRARFAGRSSGAAVPGCTFCTESAPWLPDWTSTCAAHARPPNIWNQYSSTLNLIKIL